MAALTVAGTALELSEGGEGDPIYIGEEAETSSGSLRNAVTGQKRTFSFVTVETIEATWDTLRAAIANGAQVTCSGSILSGDSITASVKASAKPTTASSPIRYIITGSGRQV